MTTISFLGMDIKVSSLFYKSGATPAWIFSNANIWKFFYTKGEYLPVLCGISAAFVLLLGYMWSLLARYRRTCAFMALLLILAPGIISQTLKVTWGRPRPDEITQFGGKYKFHESYQPNAALTFNKNDGNSFPSGHAATGFYMIFLYYFFKRRWVFTLGAFYGGLMGVGRMVQGGHFLSDIVTSFFIVYITADVLNMLILNKHTKETRV